MYLVLKIMLLIGLNRTCVVGHVELRLLVIFLILKCLIMVYHKNGSCVGPQLFSYYTHPITDVIERYSDVKYHFYADDTQLYICVDPRKPGETDRAISI